MRGVYFGMRKEGRNRLLADGTGPNALARFDRDVLAQAGVRYLVVLEGIDDIGTLTRTKVASEAQHDELVRQLINVYRGKSPMLVIGGELGDCSAPSAAYCAATCSERRYSLPRST